MNEMYWAFKKTDPRFGDRPESPRLLVLHDNYLYDWKGPDLHDPEFDDDLITVIRADTGETKLVSLLGMGDWEDKMELFDTEAVAWRAYGVKCQEYADELIKQSKYWLEQAKLYQ